MGFNSVSELQDCIMQFEDDERNLFYECNAYLKQLKEVGFFDSNRRQIKSRVSQIKKELKTAKANKDYYSTLLSSYSRFSSNIFLPFLAEYLTKTTGKKYVVKSEYESNGCFLNVATGLYDEDGTYYDVIAPEEKNSNDKRSISIESCSSFSLLDGLKLREEFSSFPHLRGLGLKLADLKIKNPTMSDQERLDTVMGRASKSSKNFRK